MPCRQCTRLCSAHLTVPRGLFTAPPAAAPRSEDAPPVAAAAASAQHTQPRSTLLSSSRQTAVCRKLASSRNARCRHSRAASALPAARHASTMRTFACTPVPLHTAVMCGAVVHSATFTVSVQGTLMTIHQVTAACRLVRA